MEEGTVVGGVTTEEEGRIEVERGRIGCTGEVEEEERTESVMDKEEGEIGGAIVTAEGAGLLSSSNCTSPTHCSSNAVIDKALSPSRCNSRTTSGMFAQMCSSCNVECEG